ncbi:hypothetical protein FQN51_000714 [Onygenales sp. PD_10]|nr:hypothetical protein FQN51_000714 [Onygenales sp. PD_10]
MAPIRRYLRISKHSVLECRIYLDNPADTRWLLDSRDPVLPRVFKSIRPLVLPKLREENERARARKKSKPVKDVLVEDDFEVSIFLREGGTSHSLVTKQKSFTDQPAEIKSNSTKLTGTDDAPIHVPDHDIADAMVIQESDDEAVVSLLDIPAAVPSAADDDADVEVMPPSSTRCRRRKRVESNLETPTEHAPEPTQPQKQDDKKLGLSTSYEGFTIWGRILCLLITRRGDKRPKPAAAAPAGGQALMEEWISTQAPQEFEE